MPGDTNMNTETAPETTGEGQMGGRKRSAWMTHVKKTMKANKGKPLSAVLKIAGKTYKKSMRGGGLSPMPVSSETGPIAQTGARRRRTSKKSRKGSKSRKH
jgi:hypothetical protein